jgi:glycosyltransferase involved in cell wall biosynthesis
MSQVLEKSAEPRPQAAVKDLVSIILPVYNQGDHLDAICRGYTTALKKLPHPYEILLVVNGPCRDDSLGVSRRIAEHDARIRVIHSAKGGWGLAVKKGMEASRGDLICYTNSARTQPSDLVLSILYAIAHPDTVIKANRKIREGWRRRLGSLLYNLQGRALFDLLVWDINGTPKVFPRAYEKLLELKSDDDMIDMEFNMIVRREGYPILEVPILSTKRHGGKSTTNMGSAFRMYWGAYVLWRRHGTPRAILRRITPRMPAYD